MDVTAIVGMDDLDRDAVVAAIASLETELFAAGAWSLNMVRQELDAPARTYFLSLDHAPSAGAPSPHVNGYAGFWYDGDDAQIMTIGVAPASQRRGIATALMDRLVAAARAQGARRILLEVRVDNEPALALYRRFGFERIGLRKRYYQPGGIDAYVMALDLEPRAVGFAPSPRPDGEDGGHGGADIEKETNEGQEP